MENSGIIGIDLGNKSRCSIVGMTNNHKVVDWCRIEYNTDPLHHRKKIIEQLSKTMRDYNYDYILFEKVNLFRGNHISKLNNIMSMAFLQCSIIENFSDTIGIAEVDVRTWKKLVLGNGNAKKEDSVEYVKNFYPEIDLEIRVPMKRVADKIVMDNDTADAALIAKYGVLIGRDWLKKNSVNYT